MAWYENRGAGASWVKHYVGALPSAMDATAGDFDDDGDMDIVAAGHDGGDRVVWFRRDRPYTRRDGPNTWTPITLKTDWTAANQVVAADVDGDGITDVVGSADNVNGANRRSGGQEVRWWRLN